MARFTLVATTDPYQLLSGDAFEYYRLATNLKRCGVFTGSHDMFFNGCEAEAQPDFGRPPGFPLMILPFVEYPQTVTMLRKIQFLQMAFGCATVVLVFFLFRRISTVVGVTAAVLCAISPHLVVTALNPITEAPFTFALVLLLASIAGWARHRTPGRAVVVGITFGILAYIRATTIYLPFFVAPLLAFYASRSRLLTAIAVLAGFLLCFGPWMVLSNGYATDTGSGSLMLNSIHNGTYPGLVVPGEPDSLGKPHRYDPTYGERDSLKKILAHLLERAAASPGQYLYWYLVGKTHMLFGWDIIGGFGDVFVYPVRYHGYQSQPALAWTHRVMYHLHWPLHIMALLACVLVWLRPLQSQSAEVTIMLRFASVIIAYFIAVHAVVTPLPRYSVPLRPLVFGLAAWLPFGIANRLRA